MHHHYGFHDLLSQNYNFITIISFLTKDQCASSDNDESVSKIGHIAGYFKNISDYSVFQK